MVEVKHEAIKSDIKMFDNAMVFNNAAQKQIEQYDEDIKNSELNVEEIKNNAASLAKDIDCYNEVKKILDKELPNFLIVKTCSFVPLSNFSYFEDYIHSSQRFL